MLLLGTAYFVLFGGTIIGRNARDSLFLKNFGVEHLPFMYAASGLLVIAGSTVYSALVERIDRRRFVKLAFFVFCGVLAACRVVLFGEFRWFYPVLYVLCQVISIVSGMLFWTATEGLYDIRQAKRLMPIVTVGGVLSMIACGFVTRPLVRLLGSANLFLVWAAMLILTLVLLRLALKGRAAAATASKPKAREGNWLASLPGQFTELTSTRLLRAMAGIALANTVVFMLVDFQFSQVMTETYKTPDELTGFLGTFRGVSGFFGLLVQVAGVPWLLSHFGVGAAIAVEPVLMLAASLFMVGSVNYGTAYAAKFIDNTLFFTVQGSSFNLLFNPLPLDRRPRLRAFIEGSFRPLMNSLGALLLVVGARYLTRREIAICAAAAGAAWVASSLMVRRGYIEALVKNLGGGSAHERLFAADALARIDNPSSLAQVAEAIRTAPAESAVPAILLLERLGRPETQAVIEEMIEHPLAKIRATAVASLGRLGNRALVAHLNTLLQDEDPRTRANAVDACVLADPALLHDDLHKSRRDPIDRVKANAIAVLAQIEERSRDDLLSQVEEMGRSSDALRRASAAYALAWFPGERAQSLLLELLEDSAPQPRRKAVRALAQSGGAASVPALVLAAGKDKSLRRECRRTVLAIFEREPAEVLARVAEGLNSSEPDTVRLCSHLLGRLDRIEALPQLIEVLSDDDPANREEALDSVERLVEHRPLPAEVRGALEVFALLELRYLEENRGRRRALLSMKLASAGAQQAALWVAEVLQGDNRWLRQRALRAAALLYDREKVQEIARGIDDPDSRKRANAIEAIEYVVPGELGKRLAAQVEIEAQTEDEPSEENLRPTNEVLRELMEHRSAVVRAATILLAGRGGIPEFEPLVEESLNDPAAIVREAAVWSTWQYLGAAGSGGLDPFEQDNLRKSVQAASREGFMLLTVEKVLFLKSVPLFASLEGEEVASLAEIAKEEDAEENKVIFEAGEAGEEFYVVVGGRLKVYRGAPGHEVLLAELGARECFGEMALLDAEPRSASVSTLEPCQLLKINAEDFRELLYEKPKISMEIMRILARRLRHADVEMEERVLLDPVEKFM